MKSGAQSAGSVPRGAGETDSAAQDGADTPSPAPAPAPDSVAPETSGATGSEPPSAPDAAEIGPVKAAGGDVALRDVGDPHGVAVEEAKAASRVGEPRPAGAGGRSVRRGGKVPAVRPGTTAPVRQDAEYGSAAKNLGSTPAGTAQIVATAPTDASPVATKISAPEFVPDPPRTSADPGPAAARRTVMSPDVVVDPPNAVSKVLGWLGSSPLLDSNPTGPVDSPILWVMSAAAVRGWGGKSGIDAGVAGAGGGVGTGLVVDDAVDPLAAPVARAAVAAPVSGGAVALSAPMAPAAPVYTVVGSAGVGRDPTSVAVAPNGARAYVANKLDKTVSVVDTTTGAVVATVPVSGSASAVAVSPSGSRAYVTLADVGKVAVIDTATNTVITSVATGSQPGGVAVSPNGSRMYVTNGGGNTMSVIDTATNRVVKSVTVGSQPGGVAVSPDGSRVYVTLKATNQVAVVNASNNTVVTKVGVGTTPVDVVLSPNGSRAYAVNSAGSVSVINTATNKVVGSTISVGAAPSSAVVSPDGSRVYVTNANDSVSVIDTATNTVVQTLTTDTVSGSGAHDIAVSADGRRLYVTDMKDRMLRRISVNWAPALTAGPTVTPNTATGVVTGSFTVADADADALSYTVAGPASGAVTISPTVGAGSTMYNYVYTPTQPARQQAAQTPGSDSDAFTVTVGDGQASVNVVVTVPISPTTSSVGGFVSAPVSAGTGPSGAAVSNGFTYVVNYESNDVTVIDSGNHVATSLNVGRGPLSVAAAEQRNRVYLTNSLDNTVSVIDSSTNTVIDTIHIDVPRGYIDNPEAGLMVYDDMVTELAVNRAGTRLYVNATDGSVTVIDTTGDADEVIRTANVGRFNDLKVSPDGTRLYGTAGVGLTVIDTATMQAVGVQVGPVWDHNAMQAEFTDSTGNVAISPDGKRTYVAYSTTTVARGVGGSSSGSFITDAQGVSWKITGGNGAVSVIDTDPASANYNQEIARVMIPNWAQDLVVSGTNLFVTTWDGRTVAVVDTTTNTLIGSFATDQTASPGRAIWVYAYYDWWPEPIYPLFNIAAFSRYIAAGPTGTVYITDYGDGKAYAVTAGPSSV